MERRDILEGLLGRFGIKSKGGEKTFQQKVSEVLLSAHGQDGMLPFWLNAVLAELLSEDQTFTLPGYDFAPNLHYTLETGFFRQLIVVVASTDQPHCRVLLYSFFATLWTSVTKQELIPHTHFSQTTVYLLSLIVENWQKGRLIPEEKGSALQLLAAVLTRIKEKASREVLFIARTERDQSYAPLDLLCCYISDESAMASCGDVVTCIVDCYMAEDQEVVGELVRNAHVLVLLVGRMAEGLDYILQGEGPETQEMERMLLVSAECVDQIMHRALVHVLIDTLSTELQSSFFSLSKAVLTRGNLKSKAKCLSLLLTISRLVQSAQFVVLFAHFLVEGDHPANPNSAEFLLAWENRLFWKLFTSENDEIRINAIGILCGITEKMNWNAVEIIFEEETSGPEIEEYCCYQDVKSLLPAASTCNFRGRNPKISMETWHSALSVFYQYTDSTIPGEVYSESALIDYILERLEKMVGNPIRENVLLMGVLTALCRYPGWNSATRSLHRRLLSKGGRKSLISVLRRVSEQLQAAYTPDLEEALAGSMIAFSLETPTTDSIQRVFQHTVPFGQSFVLFQEFAEEIAEAAEMQQTFGLSRYVS